MTKAKEKPADPTLDYQQLAEHMLGSWQDQWRQFATNKENPFASAYGDWMSNWSSAMTGWTGAPGDAPTPKAEETTKNAAASTTAQQTTTAAPTSDARTTASVPPAAAAPSNARDVLLTELARRVEFLHERVVSLETELERIKSANKAG